MVQLATKGWAGGAGTYVQKVPDDTASNQWLVPVSMYWGQFLKSPAKRRPGGRPRGASRFSLITYEITVDSGSGANEWRVRPVLFLNNQQHKDDWQVLDLPGFPGPGKVAPYRFSDADVPGDFGPYRVPLSLASTHFGLLFERSGAGSNVLEVKHWVNR